MNYNDVLLVYITCESEIQAREIGRQLLEKKLCGCVNIVPGMTSCYVWPVGSDTIEESGEVVLLAKTFEEKYQELEDEVARLHSYEVACVLAVPVKHVSEKYYEWLVNEMR